MKRTRAIAAAAVGFSLAALPLRAAPPTATSLEARIVEVAEKVKPSVVFIEAIVRVNDRRSQVTGSGFVVSADGRILTNEHVVDKAEKVTVTVPGTKKRYSAVVVGADSQTDVALLRIEPDAPLTPVEFATGEPVRVGQWVLAIGNPYGLDGTVSLGIVSAQGRNLEIPRVLNDFIQTDAMIDRGSSGGPLVDLDGRVVGVNSRGQGRGIGFTIPIDTALDVMHKLESGELDRGYLGVSLQPLDRELADYFGVPDTTGVVVNSVVDGSPADRAGLSPGEIITHLDGRPLEAEKPEDIGIFQRLVAGVAPGEKVELALLRDGKARTLEVKVGHQPTADPAEAESDAGFQVQEITAYLARDQRLDSDRGAFVTYVSRGSPASEAGLSIGDVVIRIEETDVAGLDDFARAMRDVEKRERFLIVAQRGAETKFLLVKRNARPTLPVAPSGDDGHAAHPRDTN